jgi:glycosyltransferase involved in cell wall biosynthesis
MQNVVVVTPTYNERDNIAALLPRLLAHGPNYSIIVVDDGSPDGTGEFVEEFGRRDPRVSVLRRTGKNGLGKAYVAGFHAALQRPVDYIVQMDADFSHDPDFVPQLVHAADVTASDLVIGSRYIAGAAIKNWPLRRNLLSRAGNQYARLLLGTRISDYTTGFTAFRADALRQLPYLEFDASGFAFQLEFKHAMQSRGMRIAELPITFLEREAGQSKMYGGIIFEA